MISLIYDRRGEKLCDAINVLAALRGYIGSMWYSVYKQSNLLLLHGKQQTPRSSAVWWCGNTAIGNGSLGLAWL